jgi:hypothetical protein
MWGPYEIVKQAFDLGVRRKQLLDGGTIKYRADDRLYRKDKVAISCFHATAGLDELYPNGGLFGTGFKMWGLNGTARVLIEYTDVARFKHMLLEPVDVKRDRYGLVYAPARNAHAVQSVQKRNRLSSLPPKLAVVKETDRTSSAEKAQAFCWRDSRCTV